MKAIRILKNSIKDAFKSVFRNFSLSVASITCSTITLILVSLAIILSANVNRFTKELEEELTIVVFLDRGTTVAEAESLETVIKSVPNVLNDSVIFQSNESVKENMQEKYKEFDSIMKNWTAETNILQHQYEIKVEDITRIEETAKAIEKIPGVDVTKYGEEMVDRLVKVFDAVEKISIIIVAALILVTAFLIGNTIKLTIYSRKTEIEIMRLIGASNTAIRLPFIFEGLFLGILGSIIPVIVTIYGYIISFENLGGKIYYELIELINPNYFVFQVALTVLGIGSLVGMIGSYRAVRKYLKI